MPQTPPAPAAAAGSGLLSRLISYYHRLAPLLRPDNVLAVGIVGSGVGLLTFWLAAVVADLRRRVVRLVFKSHIISRRANRTGYEQIAGLITSLCRDDRAPVEIVGDEGPGSSDADDVLTHDQEKTLLKLQRGMPPVAVRFVPGLFDASLFYVADKDPSKRRHWIKHIVFIRRSGDPEFWNQLIPESLLNTGSWVWNSAGLRDLVRSVVGEATMRALAQSAPPDRRQKDAAFNIFTWRDMGYLAALVQDDAAHFHKQRMTKSLVIRDLANGLRVVGSPRPMSTIAMDEESDIMNLRLDVRAFFQNPKVFSRLTDNHRPYQRINVLHGPPGNGKSSILQALAIEWGIQCYVMNLKSDTSDKETIKRKLRPTLDGFCLVVFEDAESVLPKPSDRSGASAASAAEDEDGFEGGGDFEGGRFGEKQTPKYSVEEFLELFDGSVQSGKPNGRLVFFTTNTPDALHPKVMSLANGIYAFLNPGMTVMSEYWANFFQDHPKDEIVRSWRTFASNYGKVWKQGGATKDHTVYKIHQNSASATRPRLRFDETRTELRKAFQFGLNGQHKFRADKVFSIALETPMAWAIPEPADWAPGFFWNVRLFFSDSTEEEFMIFELSSIGATELFLQRHGTS